MCAQNLTEKQQKNTLSYFAKPKSQSVRNVLAQPYSEFWPIVHDDDCLKDITSLLRKLLQSAKKAVSEEDQQLLHKARGRNNRERRLELLKLIRAKNSQSQHQRKWLALGVNEVSCSLEKDELGALIIAADADPPMLTRHLGTLAASRNVPYVALPGLKSLTGTALDFSCLAVGLKKNVVEKETIFSQLQLKILSAAKAAVEKYCENDAEVSVKNKTSECFSDPQHSPKTCSAHAVEEIYLKRESRHYRVFVPGMGPVQNITDTQPQYLSFSIADQSDNLKNIQVHSKCVQMPLGSDNPIRGSFAQRVKQKIAESAVFQRTCVSTLSPSFSQPNQTVLVGKESLKPKHVSRYFDATLSSLKVKKIQGNPLKQKCKSKRVKNP